MTNEKELKDILDSFARKYMAYDWEDYDIINQVKVNYITKKEITELASLALTRGIEIGEKELQEEWDVMVAECKKRGERIAQLSKELAKSDADLKNAERVAKENWELVSKERHKLAQLEAKLKENKVYSCGNCEKLEAENSQLKETTGLQHDLNEALGSSYKKLEQALSKSIGDHEATSAYLGNEKKKLMMRHNFSLLQFEKLKNQIAQLEKERGKSRKFLGKKDKRIEKLRKENEKMRKQIVDLYAKK